MRGQSWLLPLVLIGHASLASPQALESAASARSGNVEIGVSFSSADSSPHRIGSKVDCPLSISYRNAPPGSSVFLVLHPLKDGALLTPAGVTVQSTGVDVDVVATVQTESDGGVFQIDRANYPEELVIPSSALETLATQVWDGAAAKKVSAAFGPHGLRLVLGFLASLGRGGEGREQAFFSFVLPKLEHGYDGVLITPMLVTYEPDGRQRIVLHSGQMRSLRITVTSESALLR